MIDTAKIAKDAVLQTMVEVGWQWTSIDYYVDLAFPQFAYQAQTALNASNHIASLVSELETALTLSVALSDVGMQHSASDKKA